MKKTTAKSKMGRPTIFTQDKADYICEEIASGRSLSKICAEPDMPKLTTVFRWLADDRYKDFRDLYTRAREEQAETYADELNDLADDVEADKDSIAKARLRIDTRKWVAAKLKPRKYGDKVDLTSDGGPLTVVVRKFGDD